MTKTEVLERIKDIQNMLVEASDKSQHAQDKLVELWEEIAQESQLEDMYDNS